MAKYEVKSKEKAENGLFLATLIITFGEGEEAKRFEQVVYLPEKEFDSKAQNYADEYETEFTANIEATEPVEAE